MSHDDENVSEGGIIRRHSKVSTFIITVLFVAAAIVWLFHVPTGMVLAIAGGIVFGVTYHPISNNDSDGDNQGQ